MPIIQMIGMLLNNILFYLDIEYINCILDISIGNFLLCTFLLYVCSYLFGFCKWHRIIITANLINLIIASIDILFVIPISDLELLNTYIIVYTIFIIIAVDNHIKNVKR